MAAEVDAVEQVVDVNEALQYVAAAIPTRISEIEKYREEIRIGRETLKAALEDDPEYVEAAEAAKLAAQKKKQLRDKIWSSQEHQALLAMIKENSEEIATLEEILTTELMQVFKEQNVDEVADENGEPRKFKVTVKLLPKEGSKNSFR